LASHDGGERWPDGADAARWPLALIVVLAFALVATLWAAVLFKVNAEERAELGSIERRTTNLARVFEEHTVRTLASVDQALLFVKFQYEKVGPALDIASAVEQGMIVSTLFNQVGVIDAQGIYSLSNLPGFKRVDLADREHFRVHVDADSRNFFVSKPVLGRASGKWSVQLTRRINRPDGSFGGVAVISLDPFYFTTFYSDVDVGRHGVVTLVGLDGIVRARRTGDATDVGQDITRSALFAALAKAPQGHYIGHSSIDGRARMVSYRTLPGLALVVAVGMDADEAMSDFRVRRGGYFAFAAGMSLVVAAFCALALWLLQRQRRISMRLHEMKQRAESANRLKSEFLASVSHELRTPLNGVIGYSELLMELAQDEEQRGYARVIFDSSGHLLELLNSILDLARVEAGQMAIRSAPEDVAELVGQVCANYQPVAQAKGVTLECEAPVGVTLECDRTRVVQVLNNLVHNALKFTDRGQVSLHARVTPTQCVFEVADTGCGIAPDQLEAIFERFRQVHDFETRAHGGTGLGLALCKELAELMGGEIEVRSTPGEGSVFSVRLPRSPKEKE
jgi:two-component system, NarL family, sensor histidine kinase BarA